MSPSWIVLECLTGRGLLKRSILSTSHPIPRQIFPRPNPNPSPQLTDPRWRLIGKCTFARSNTPALQVRLIVFTTLQPHASTSTTAQVLSMGYVRGQINVAVMTDTLVCYVELFLSGTLELWPTLGCYQCTA